jgi:hypothetical protein
MAGETSKVKRNNVRKSLIESTSLSRVDDELGKTSVQQQTAGSQRPGAKEKLPLRRMTIIRS